MYNVKDVNSYDFGYGTNPHRAVGKQIKSVDINCKM